MIQENGGMGGSVNGSESENSNVFDIASLPDGSILEYENRNGIFQMVIAEKTSKGSVRCFRKKLNRKGVEEPAGDWIFFKKGRTELAAGNTFVYETNDDDDSGLKINKVPVIKKIRLIKIR